MSVLFSLPRELRDEIYTYFVPEFPIRYHLRTQTWEELKEWDAMSCSDKTASTRSRKTSSDMNHPDLVDSDAMSITESDKPSSIASSNTSSRSPGSTIFTDDEDFEEEERRIKAGIRTLLLLNQQVHAEFIEALGRLAADVTLYLYMENTPFQPQDFTFDSRFWAIGYRQAVQRLIVLAKWHAVDGGRQCETELTSGHAQVNSTQLSSPAQGRGQALEIQPFQPEPRFEFENRFDRERGGNCYQHGWRVILDKHRHIDRLDPRLPNEFLDMSETSARLLTAVKHATHHLPNVSELHVTLDVGGATSENLSDILETHGERALNVKDFLEWKPTPEDGLERIVHINKRLLAGSYKNWPSGVEEWRRGINEANLGQMVPREESGGWWNVMEEELVKCMDDPNWHIWPALHLPDPVDFTVTDDDHALFSTKHMMEGDVSVKRGHEVKNLDARWAIMTYDPEAPRNDDEASSWVNGTI